jgi:hypothetical protein
MKNRLVVAASAAALAVSLLGVAPAGPALAQDDSGGTITIGGDIAGSVAGAVSSIVTGGSSGGSASGGESVEHTEASFGEDEGLAISDASGGNHNLSAKSKK